VRDTPAEPFRYLRIPADDEGSIDGWCGCARRSTTRPCASKAVRRYVAQGRRSGDKPEMAEQLRVGRACAGLFAGAEEASGQRRGGLQAISDFIEAACPRPSASAHLRGAAAHPQRQPVRAERAGTRERGPEAACPKAKPPSAS
jgi:cytochrome c biogenesis protein